jgi:hypothetical protein
MEYKGNFSIFSKKLTPEELNSLLGITADAMMHIGEPRVKGSKLKWDENVWVLRSKSESGRPLAEHLQELIDRLLPHSERLEMVVDKCEFFFDCVIEGDENPELNFPPQLIKSIAKLNAALDVDLYVAD